MNWKIVLMIAMLNFHDHDSYLALWRANGSTWQVCEQALKPWWLKI